MPNWCSTDISINCKTKEQAKMLFDKIKTWSSSNTEENGFGESWLGNIVRNSGIGEPGTDFSCRGSIVYLDIAEDTVIISTETAWAPMLDMWIAIIKRYANGADMIYKAEEPGGLLFISNDPSCVNTYYIDIWDHGEYDCTEYGASEDCAIESLRDALNSNMFSIEDLLDEAEYDMGILVAKYEYCEA